VHSTISLPCGLSARQGNNSVVHMRTLLRGTIFSYLALEQDCGVHQASAPVFEIQACIQTNGPFGQKRQTTLSSIRTLNTAQASSFCQEGCVGAKFDQSIPKLVPPHQGCVCQMPNAKYPTPEGGLNPMRQTRRKCKKSVLAHLEPFATIFYVSGLGSTLYGVLHCKRAFAFTLQP
jgi:hypothetical protein